MAVAGATGMAKEQMPFQLTRNADIIASLVRISAATISAVAEAIRRAEEQMPFELTRNAGHL